MNIFGPTPLARGLVRKKVDIVNYADGRFAVRFNGIALGFKVFDKIRTVDAGMVAETKRFSEVLARVHDQQANYDPNRRRFEAARQRPPNDLQAPGAPTKGRPSRAMRAASQDDRRLKLAPSHGLPIVLGEGGAARPGCGP